MALTEADELRHAYDRGEYNWRESLYFNFNDPVNGIGCWIYLWVVPNKELPSGMLVSLYHGEWPDITVNDRAMAAPGHMLRDGNRWIYCYKKDFEHLVEADFDDVSLGGLRLKRIEPLRRYELAFDDGEGNSFAIDCQFLTPPYDYADGVNPTPPWIAKNRYHRAWRAKGQLRLGGQRYDVACTGDSDHSWGLRDMDSFGANLFKMWSFQSADGRLAVSVLKQGVDDAEVALGFVSIDGEMASAATVETSARFDDNGVQSDVTLVIHDALGRTVRARFGKMHSHLGSGAYTRFWGWEGVGDYEVEGWGAVPGLVSYFWPPRVTPALLAAGEVG